MAFGYICGKHFCEDTAKFPSLCQYINSSMYGHLDTEKSEIHFVEVLSLKADSQDIIELVLRKIYHIHL